MIAKNKGHFSLYSLPHQTYEEIPYLQVTFIPDWALDFDKLVILVLENILNFQFLAAFLGSGSCSSTTPTNTN
jgi:hypothetical protein